MQSDSTATGYYKVSKFIGKKLIDIIEFFISLNVKGKKFDPYDFVWTKEIELNFENIRKEFDALKALHLLTDINMISEEQKKVVENQKWLFFPLMAYGIPLVDNMKKCPETSKLIAKIPLATTVFFSNLTPGTYIKPHRGAYKGYLRYHLGLDIPEQSERCALRLEDKLFYWGNGESLIFDDTYMHDAWNYTEKERVVLYVDFIRPMPKPLVAISIFLTKLIRNSPFIKNALKNMSKNQQSELSKTLS